MANDKAQLKLDKIINADKASGLLTKKSLRQNVERWFTGFKCRKYDIVSFIEDKLKKLKKENWSTKKYYILKTC